MITLIGKTEADEKALAGLAVVDLSDDGFDYHGRVIEKPWGHEYQVAASKENATWVLHIRAGSETSMHCHPGKETELTVVNGEVVLWYLGGQYVLRVGDRAFVSAGAFHRTSTAEGAILIEVETPPNKKDLVRLSDKYGREGKGYERVE